MRNNKKVLIIDDEAHIRRVIELKLRQRGYEVLQATDGEQGLDLIHTQRPDAVITDIMMPKLSGYEVCQQLKENAETRDIPVLMVTALKEMGDIEKAVAAGADDFLTKPVHRLELLTRVRSLLRVRHLKNERDRLLAYLAEVDAPHPPEATAQ